jgi:hypothetical protein
VAKVPQTSKVRTPFNIAVADYFHSGLTGKHPSGRANDKRSGNISRTERKKQMIDERPKKTDGNGKDKKTIFSLFTPNIYLFSIICPKKQRYMAEYRISDA